MSLAVNPARCDEAGKPQFNLQLLMVAITLAAVVSALSPFIDGRSHIVISIYALTFLFGCCKTRRAVLFVLPALYLPFAWMVLSSGPFEFVRVADFWYRPGLSLLGQTQATGMSPVDLLAIALTLLVFFVAILLGRTSSRAAAMVSLNLFCLCWLGTLVLKA